MSSPRDGGADRQMDETGDPIPATCAHPSRFSGTLPSTSRAMRSDAAGTAQARLADGAKAQKSSSAGSFHHSTLRANTWSFDRFHPTPAAQSELDPSLQMQKPTTESKNSSVRYKTKKMGANISVANVSTGEICSLLDTLCSEENRSSEVFDNSTDTLDRNSESTTPLKSGQSCDASVENGVGRIIGVMKESPSGKTFCSRQGEDMKTVIVRDKEENSGVDGKDQTLNPGAKTIVKTADTIIQILDGSLSIKGRFHEIVIRVNEKVLKKAFADAATETDTDITSFQPATHLSTPETNCIGGNICLNAEAKTSVTESRFTSDMGVGFKTDSASGLHSESPELNYRLLNSDPGDESSFESQGNGLNVDIQGVDENKCTDVGQEVASVQLSVPAVSDVSSEAHTVTVCGVRGQAEVSRSRDVDSARKQSLITAYSQGVISLPDTTHIKSENSVHGLGKSEVESIHDKVNPSELNVWLPCSSIESHTLVPSCFMPDVTNDGVALTSACNENVLKAVKRWENDADKEDGADRIRHGISDSGNGARTAVCEVETSPGDCGHEQCPGLTAACSQQGQESDETREGQARSGGQGHGEDLDLDDCQVSAGLDSSTLVDSDSPDSQPPDLGTADKDGGTVVVATDAKMLLLPQESDSSGSLVDECGLVDVYKLTQQATHQTRRLNKLFDKYRARVLKTERLHKYLEQLNQEKEEMCRLLQGVNKETAALRLEASELRCTVSAVCDVAVTTIGKETEARRLEPTCYRRYSNIRTVADASNALTAVRCRIKALNDLEVLIYRKQLMLNHVLPSLQQDSTQHPKASLLGNKAIKSKKSEHAGYNRGSRSSVVIEVLSEPNSWSELQTYTDSQATLSTALTTSVEATASVGQLTGTDV